MSQINLLKQKTNSSNWSQTGMKALVRVMAAGLLCLILYYGWLNYNSSKLTKDILTTQQKLKQEADDALTISQRDEVLTRQLQLKTLQGAIGSHVYWSQLLPELARVTLKTASYTSLKVGDDSTLMLNASVPSLSDLDKYLQVFDRPEFNKYFSNVRIGGYSKAQGAEGGSGRLTFEVVMNFDSSVLEYKANNQ